MSFLDFLFPKRCVNCRKIGSYICPKCFSYIAFMEGGTCTGCQRPAIGGVTHPVCQMKYMPDGVFSSLVYSNVVKKLVYNFKYKPYLTHLAGSLVDLFYEGLIQKEHFYRTITKDTLLVPIPLHPMRARKRGYNQSLLLANGLAKRFDLTVADCLSRVKNTVPQVGLSQKERQENIKDAFALKSGVNMQDVAQVFLIDDVVTSGATLKEAAKLLKKVGVGKVWGVTLAHGN